MRVFLVFVSATLLGACTEPPKPQPAPEQAAAKTEPAEAAPTEDAKPKPKPLSEEDKRLIALDPSDLSPEMRRKRAYALRRKAMQNPDSAVARTLADLQRAHQNGEIDPKASMPTFTVDGKPPRSGRGPAGTRSGPAGARKDPAE